MKELMVNDQDKLHNEAVELLESLKITMITFVFLRQRPLKLARHRPVEDGHDRLRGVLT